MLKRYPTPILGIFADQARRRAIAASATLDKEASLLESGFDIHTPLQSQWPYWPPCAEPWVQYALRMAWKTKNLARLYGASQETVASPLGDSMTKARKAARPAHKGPTHFDPPAPALNAEERLDRRQNAINSARRNLTIAQKAHADALDRFNETSPCDPGADEAASALTLATKTLSAAWKAVHDLCAHLS